MSWREEAMLQAPARLSSRCTESETELAVGGNYQFRARGEYHLFNPQTIAKLQHAVRQNSFETFQEYTDLIDKQNRQLSTLRGLLEIKTSDAADSARGSGAGERDRQAFRHRRHVVRLDLARRRTKPWPSP